MSYAAFNLHDIFGYTFQPAAPLAALAGLFIEISFTATFTQRFFNA